MNNFIILNRGDGIGNGVYQIRNVFNNKVYVGSTGAGLARRKAWHFSALNNNKHHSIKLQRAYNKYGKENFIFEILEYCESSLVIPTEQYWIDKLNSHYDGYNILKIAGSCRGRKLTDEHKRKISNSEKGKYVSDETRKRISLSKVGFGLGTKRGPLSEAIKTKIGNANRGRKCTNETKDKISKKLIGKIVSDKTKIAMSIGRGKSVANLDIRTNKIIEVFHSCSAAERKYGYLNQGISRAAIRGQKYKGYFWKYL